MNHINYANKVTQQYSEDNNQTTQTRTWHADVWKILKSTHLCLTRVLDKTQLHDRRVHAT